MDRLLAGISYLKFGMA